MQRRDFIRTGAVIGAASVLPFQAFGKATSEKARIGFIGVGLRGRNHLNNLLMRDDVIVPVLSQTDKSNLNSSDSEYYQLSWFMTFKKSE